jgi:hypothetical protein
MTSRATVERAANSTVYEVLVPLATLVLITSTGSSYYDKYYNAFST